MTDGDSARRSHPAAQSIDQTLSPARRRPPELRGIHSGQITLAKPRQLPLRSHYNALGRKFDNADFGRATDNAARVYRNLCDY